MTCNTAVFYDVENLISLFSTKSNRTLQLDEIHRRILALEVVQGISVQKAYADWMLQINRNLRSYVLQIGIEPVQIFNTNQNDRVKNAADVSLIIDAVELLARHPEIENYVIASGDGIFAFLAKKLHEYGKRVIGCGFDRNTNIIFRNACDIFMPLEKTDISLTAVIKNLNKGTILPLPPSETELPDVPAASTQPAAQNTGSKITERPVYTPPVISPSSELKIPNKLPKNRFSEILIQSGIPIWKNARDLSASLHIMKRMIETIFEWGDADNDLEISLFKAYVDHFLPNFRIGQYGFKRFGEFMRFLVTASPYCLIETGGTVLRIARRESVTEKKGEKDVILEDIRTLLFTKSNGQTVRSLFDIDEGIAFTFDLKALSDTTVMPDTKAQTDIDVSQEQSRQEENADIDIKHESARMFIKNTFTRLSDEDKLAAREIRRLMTEEYAQKTFGVKVPICKELHSRAHLREQRLVNGKILYWKDEFKFNGKSYLIFKEWTERQHRAKFEDWLKKIKK